MNNGLYIKLGAILSVVFVIIMFFSTYNTLVEKEEVVIESWSQVESVMQRKLDLIPNLVKTVKAYALHEKEVLVKTTQARSQTFNSLVSKIETDSSELKSLSFSTLPKASQLKNIASLNKSLDKSLFKLMAVSENYPDLKSSQNYMALQAQLEGSENRINITRMNFNSSVKDYNAYIRKMPANILASIGGFSRKAYFKADEESFDKMDIKI